MLKFGEFETTKKDVKKAGVVAKKDIKADEDYGLEKNKKESRQDIK